jgi:hypothetical protein
MAAKKMPAKRTTAKSRSKDPLGKQLGKERDELNKGANVRYIDRQAVSSKPGTFGKKSDYKTGSGRAVQADGSTLSVPTDRDRAAMRYLGTRDSLRKVSAARTKGKMSKDAQKKLNAAKGAKGKR